MSLHVLECAKKIIVMSFALLFSSFFTTLFAVEDRSIQVIQVPSESFLFSYEIYVPKGIDKIDKKYFYVLISVTKEVVKALGGDALVTATTYFPFRSVDYNPFIKVAETNTGLQELERRGLPHASLHYLMTKKAIQMAIKDYHVLKEKFSTSQKKIVQIHKGNV